MYYINHLTLSKIIVIIKHRHIFFYKLMKLLTIKSRQDFLRIQNNFKIKYYSNNFLILLLESNTNNIKQQTINNINNNYVKLGITATKKIDKRAVIRNTIKRKVREIFRILIKNNADLFINNCDYEVITKKSILDVPFTELQNEFIKCLQNTKEQYGTKNISE